MSKDKDHRPFTIELSSIAQAAVDVEEIILMTHMIVLEELFITK